MSKRTKNTLPTYYQKQVESFKKILDTLGYATAKNYERKLAYFFTWLVKNKIYQIEDIQFTDLQNYVTHLLHKPKKGGGALSISYVQGNYAAIKLFNEHRCKLGEAPFILKKVNIPSREETETEVLSLDQIKKLYAVTDNSPQGYQDRAILSLLYGCGLRITEAQKIELHEIYYAKELLYVKPSKNGKSRYIPINEVIQRDLKEYQDYARKIYADPKHKNTSFLLSTTGKPITKDRINKRLKALAEEAKITQRIYAHLLRHSIATHLLQAGMDLEDISTFLGHNSLRSTEVYTHIVEQIKHDPHGGSEKNEG